MLAGWVAAVQEVAELRRQIAMEQAVRQKKDKPTDSDLPTEFECCFCTSKVRQACPSGQTPAEWRLSNVLNGSEFVSLCSVFCCVDLVFSALLKKKSGLFV